MLYIWYIFYKGECFQLGISFFDSLDKLAIYIQKSFLCQSVKDDILAGRLSPFVVYDMHLEDDSVEHIYRRCFLNSDVLNSYGSLLKDIRKNDIAALYGSSKLCSDIFKFFQDFKGLLCSAVNDSHTSNDFYQRTYSYSRSMGTVTYKYGAANWFSYNKDNDALICSEVNMNSIYIRVYLDSEINRETYPLMIDSQDYKTVRIPFREMCSEACILSRISAEFGCLVDKSEILQVLLWDFSCSLYNIPRDKMGRVKKLASYQLDQECITTFIPKNSYFIRGCECVQLFKLYLLSKVLKFETKYIKELESLIYFKCKYNDYPRKIPMSDFSRQSLIYLYNLLDNENILDFERNYGLYTRGQKGQLTLNYINRCAGYIYLNELCNSAIHGYAPCYQSFNPEFLQWVYKNIFKVEELK